MSSFAVDDGHFAVNSVVSPYNTHVLARSSLSHCSPCQQCLSM